MIRKEGIMIKRKLLTSQNGQGMTEEVKEAPSGVQEAEAQDQEVWKEETKGEGEAVNGIEMEGGWEERGIPSETVNEQDATSLVKSAEFM